MEGNDKWQCRQFKEEAEARSFAALKQVEMGNKGRAQRTILSYLTQEHHDAAVSVTERLGGAYAIVPMPWSSNSSNTGAGFGAAVIQADWNRQ